MAPRSRFTHEQSAELRENPCVSSVTKTTITFTAEFKRQFHERRQKGETARDIFRSCGIDPDILGEGRIRGFVQSVARQAVRKEGFVDQRRYNRRGPGGQPDEGQSEDHDGSIGPVEPVQPADDVT